MKKALAALPKDRLADAGAILSLAAGLALLAAVAVPLSRIASNPELGTGTVTSKHKVDGGRESPDSFTVRYSFKVPSGREYAGSVGVDERTYEQASVGDALEVMYASDDPSNNRAAKASVQSIHIEGAAVLAMMVGVFAYLGPWRWFLRWRGKPDPALQW